MLHTCFRLCDAVQNEWYQIILGVLLGVWWPDNRSELPSRSSILSSVSSQPPALSTSATHNIPQRDFSSLSVRCAVMTMKSILSVFLLSRICSLNARSYFDSDTRDNIFRPSIELSQLNTSTLSVSSLPMQPLAPHLRPDTGAQERLAISFDEEYSDIGNIDYTQSSVSSYRGQRGIQGEHKCVGI